MEGLLKIKNVEVDGFCNIDHVIMRELTDRIVLEGVNGVGKTMILTAIRAALEGKTALPEKPLSEWIKNGHESAIIRLDLADGTVVKFSIRVVITANDFDLQVKEVSEDGKSKKIAGGPMAFLKSVVNTIAFRPQQWRKRSDKEQLDEVFGYFPDLKSKLQENDKKLSDVGLERARLLEKAKVLRLDIERAPFTPNLPEKEIQADEILVRLKAAQEHNKGLEDLNADLKSSNTAVERITTEILSLESEKIKTMEMIAKLNEQLAEQEQSIVFAKQEMITATNVTEAIKGRIAAFVEKPTAPIELELTELNTKNESIRKNIQQTQNIKDLEAAELSARTAFEKIKTITAERSAVMATAEIPIDGLSIGDGCLLYPNSDMEMVRLSALSDGEFWPVACGLVAAFKPRVRIVIIDNMHDLDKSNFEALVTAATKHGMQIWIHKTLWDESEAGAGFLIRDGQIIGAPKGEV
jgi:hypothetical protein